MTRSGWGGFLNYDLLAEHVSGASSVNAALEFGAFSPHGSGTSTFLGRWSDRHVRFTRLETRWTFDDPARMRSLRLGDGITRGGGGGGAPLRFGGIQFARNFEVQPGFVTLPMRTLSGNAALPSVVDVYVNDVLQGRHEVSPGPFAIIDLPVVAGNGEVQLVVRDLLGRETIVRQSYYAAAQLLRSGLHDFSYEAGFLRRAFGQRSADYGPMFAAATQRYGISDQLTGEVHLEATREVQVAGVSAVMLWPGVGLFSVGAAASESGPGTGASVRAAFERRTPTLSFGAVAEFLTDDFVTVGSDPARERPRSTIQAFAGLPLSFGSVGVSYLRRQGRTEPAIEIVSANVSIRLGRLGTLNLAGRRSFGRRDETAVELFLSIPLGPRTYAGGGLTAQGGERSLTAMFQRNLAAGPSLGYRIAAVLGHYDRLDGQVDLSTGHGNYNARLSWANGEVGARVGAAGSIGTVDGHLFASRRLSRSFAAVQVGDFPNVRVYADNQLVARTGRDGVAVVPHLRPFERNPIRIELADLPMDAQVGAEEQSVRPYDRSGVSLEFDVQRSDSAMLNVRLENGEPLPAGANVRLAGGQAIVSAPGGDVYLTGLQPRNVVVAEYEGGACSFELVVPETADPQPRLGQFICEQVAQ